MPHSLKQKPVQLQLRISQKQQLETNGIVLLQEKRMAKVQTVDYCREKINVNIKAFCKIGRAHV